MQNTTPPSSLSTIYAKHWGKIWLAQALLIFFVSFTFAWNLRGAFSPRTAENEAHQHAESEPKIWTCSMHPQIRRDAPGKCPLCGMDLVPVSPSKGGMRTITISPAARKLMRIETAPVERRYVTADVRMVGKVEYDETKLAHITAWVPGRLDRLFVNYTGINVEKGHHLVYVYSEQLYSAQEELLQALKNRSERPRTTTRLIKPLDLVASAREKLRLLGLTAEQIQEIESRDSPTDHVTIYSPIAGVVIDKLREEGDRVRVGDRIYTVADLKQVWIKLDAYESDLQWLRYGQEVEFTTEAYPGEVFSGRIAFIDPVLNKDTRTVKVRVNVSNLDGRLKPEMFVKATVRSQVASGGRVLDASLVGKWISPMHPEIVSDEPGDCEVCGMPLVRAESLGYITATPQSGSKPLVIPTSAALVTGKRAIVYVETPTAEEPTFEGREVVLGPRARSHYLVKRGLKEGELVVTNGNFKLDSALQISAKPSMMTPEGGGGGGHDHGSHSDDASPKPKSKTSHQMAAPAQFKSQLGRLLTARDGVASAIEKAELAEIRSAFIELRRALDAVDAKPLQDQARAMWDELAMLVGNDAVVGQDVVTLRDADDAFLSLQRNLQRVSAAFGLPGDEEPRVVQLAVTEQFREQLSRLWAAYLLVSQSLAADDLSVAKQGVPRLSAAVNSVDSSSLEEAAAARWEDEKRNLVQIVQKLAEARDINLARSAFALLSEEMLVLVKSFGVGASVQIYEAHCPMAFDNRGASWLQSEKAVRNPYFGAKMLKCADRVDLIWPQASGNASPPSSHTDHQHQR